MRGDDEATELVLSVLNTTDNDDVRETALFALQRFDSAPVRRVFNIELKTVDDLELGH